MKIFEFNSVSRVHKLVVVFERRWESAWKIGK